MTLLYELQKIRTFAYNALTKSARHFITLNHMGLYYKIGPNLLIPSFLLHFIPLQKMVKVMTRSLTTHHNVKTNGLTELQVYSFLISALDGGERSVSCSSHFIPGERGPSIYWLLLSII
jgi:hypothetical protein